MPSVTTNTLCQVCDVFVVFIFIELEQIWVKQLKRSFPWKNHILNSTNSDGNLCMSSETPLKIVRDMH